MEKLKEAEQEVDNRTNGKTASADGRTLVNQCLQLGKEMRMLGIYCDRPPLWRWRLTRFRQRKALGLVFPVICLCPHLSAQHSPTQ